MNYGQIETNEMMTGRTAEGMGAEIEPGERQNPLWLSAGEAEMLLSMCSLSPVSAGELEEVLFRKMGRLLVSFETPHPKEL